jgi:hypothetical protein
MKSWLTALLVGPIIVIAIWAGTQIGTQVPEQQEPSFVEFVSGNELEPSESPSPSPTPSPSISPTPQPKPTVNIPPSTPYAISEEGGGNTGGYLPAPVPKASRNG